MGPVGRRGGGGMLTVGCYTGGGVLVQEAHMRTSRDKVPHQSDVFVLAAVRSYEHYAD